MRGTECGTLGAQNLPVGPEHRAGEPLATHSQFTEQRRLLTSHSTSTRTALAGWQIAVPQQQGRLPRLGNAGNPSDTHDAVYGGVDYEYSIIDYPISSDTVTGITFLESAPKPMLARGPTDPEDFATSPRFLLNKVIQLLSN